MTFLAGFACGAAVTVVAVLITAAWLFWRDGVEMEP
jgi:hypothetical protein